MTKELEPIIERLDWVIWFSNDDRDYLLSWDVAIPELTMQDDIYFSYNQAKQQKTRNDCTLYWPITAVSNLMNYKFSDAEIMEIVALSRERENWWSWTMDTDGSKVCSWPME